MTVKTEGAAAAGQFDALLAELGEVNKAMDEADAAAAGGAEEGAAVDPAAEGGAGDGSAAPGDEGDEVVKSFSVTRADGTVEDAIDATDILKALVDEHGEMKDRVIPAMFGVIKRQGEMMKALVERVRVVEGSGRGRRAVVTMTPRGVPDTVTKALGAEGGAVQLGEGEMTPDQFMTKAMDMNAAGELTAIEISMIEGRLNQGKEPPAALLARVSSYKKT